MEKKDIGVVVCCRQPSSRKSANKQNVR